MKYHTVLVAAAGLCLACSATHRGEVKRPALSPSEVGAAPELPQPSDDLPPVRITLDLDAAVHSCGFTQAHFAYDEAELKPRDEAELAALAQCLNAEPFADHELRLVGRADDRGPNEYNQNLGLERAQSVKRALVDHGVDADRIRLTTTGEAAAVGGAESDYSHGWDRRTDVIELGVVYAPR